MDTVVSKILSLGLLFVLTAFAGTLPVFIVHSFRKKENTGNECDLERRFQTRHGLLISLLLNFGGGVLLSTCLIHLLPEVRELFVAGFREQDEVVPNFPVVEGVICTGFFLVYAMEEFVMAYIKHRNCHSHLNAAGHNLSPAMLACENEDTAQCSHGANNNCENVGLVGTTSAKSYGTRTETSPRLNPESSAVNGLFLIIALSFHSIFEGMSIGLQGTPMKVWMIFLGMSIHKVILAFCVGLETILHVNNGKLVIFYMLVFASVSPIGGIVGSLVDSVAIQAHIVVVVLQAISAGTVLYVTFFEIFFQEKRNEQPGLLKLLSAVIGFGVMSALSLMES